MAVSSRAWSGWIGFAGLAMVVIGSIDFFEGLIAVIRKHYYVATPNQIVVFNTTTWGWITMILGVLLVLVGFGLVSGAGWARWTAIVILVVNLIEQLAWLGNSSYPLWTLTVVALEIVVLYALTVRWSEGTAGAGAM
jgi:hypothetical protein